jgi:L-seryl-tRNA(Ser) seleniumtransferase
MGDSFMTTASVFSQFGVRPVINACGIYTDLGGSILSPSVWAAVEQVNGSFVDMVELLDRSGGRIAELIGVEAARVTPGASAAVALGVGACLTRGDRDRFELLPEAETIPHEVLLQRNHRYKYARCAELAGARLVHVGGEAGTRLDEVAGAIGPGTAAILHPAHLDGQGATVPLSEVAAVARERGVPIVVDAAYMCDPPELMGSFTRVGADLVCFSAKYFGGPNAGGFIAGRRDLIAAVAAIDFTRHESGPYRRFGRAFKLDRHAVVATVLALEEWLAMDHAARWAGYARQVERLGADLADLPGLRLTPLCFTMDERLLPEPVNCLHLRFGPGVEQTVEAVAAELAAGDPAIRCIVEPDALVFVVETLRKGDEQVIALRLRALLGRQWDSAGSAGSASALASAAT